MEDYEAKMFEHYIEIGAVEVDSITEDGEFLYKITDLAKDVAPELWQMHMAMVEETITELIEKDLVNIEYDEELKANVKISPQGIKVLKEMGYDF